MMKALQEKLHGMDVKKLLPKTIPYVIVFYIVEKEAWLFRHCTGDSFVTRLMVLFQNFGLAFKNPLPSLYPLDMGIGIVGSALLYALIVYKRKNAKKYRPGEEYGSARWGNSEGH